MQKKTIYSESKSGTRETCLGITISFYKKFLAFGQVLPCFCQYDKRVKNSLRPALESQSPLTRNCWLRTGCLLVLLKMASDEDETSSDSFYERYRHSDFLYFRNDQYKNVDLDFFEKQHVEKYFFIDLLKFDFRKVIICDNL